MTAQGELMPPEDALVPAAGAAPVVPTADPTASAIGVLKAVLDNPERLEKVPIDTVERMFALARQLGADEAQRQFHSAFRELQSKLEPVRRTGFNSHTKSYYAKLEKVCEMLDPLILAHGFSKSFSMVDCSVPNHIRIKLRLRHDAGHVEDHFWDAPIDVTGPGGKKNKTELHGTASSMTYSERHMLVNVFGVQTIIDDDGNRGAGVGPSNAKITDLEASDLQAALEEASGNASRFLQHFGIARFEDLPVDRHKEALTMVEQRRQRGPRRD